MTAVAVPKRILVNDKPIRLRWAQQAAWGFVAANIGALIISALYYLFIELRWHIGSHTFLYLKPDWDKLFTYKGWNADRHDVRNVYEGVFATLFVKSLLANWKKARWEAPGWYVAVSPVLILIAAFIPVAVGIFLINHAGPWIWQQWALTHGHVIHNPVHLNGRLSALGTYLSGYPWQPAAIGVLTGLVVHRVYAPAGDTVQMYFVGRSVDRTRDALKRGDPDARRHLPRWPLPPTIRERAAWIMEQDLPVRDRTGSITAAVWFAVIVLGSLAGYGGYIRYVVAKGH
jgi:hypothetical protein